MEKCVYGCRHVLYGGQGFCVQQGAHVSLCVCSSSQFRSRDKLGRPSCVNDAADLAIHLIIILLAVLIALHGIMHRRMQNAIMRSSGVSADKWSVQDTLRCRLPILEICWACCTVLWCAVDLGHFRFQAMFPAFFPCQVIFVFACVMSAHLWISALPRTLLAPKSWAAKITERCLADSTDNLLVSVGLVLMVCAVIACLAGGGTDAQGEFRPAAALNALQAVILVVTALDSFLINVVAFSLMKVVENARNSSLAKSRQYYEYKDTLKLLKAMCLGANCIMLSIAGLLLVGLFTTFGRSTPLLFYTLLHGGVPGLWVAFNVHTLARKPARGEGTGSGIGSTDSNRRRSTAIAINSRSRQSSVQISPMTLANRKISAAAAYTASPTGVGSAGRKPWSPNLQRQRTITERIESESLMSNSDRSRDSHSGNNKSGRYPSPLSEQGLARILLKVAPEKSDRFNNTFEKLNSSRVLPFVDVEGVTEEQHTDTCSGSDSSHAAPGSAKLDKAGTAAAVQPKGARQETYMHLEPAEDFDEE